METPFPPLRDPAAAGRVESRPRAAGASPGMARARPSGGDAGGIPDVLPGSGIDGLQFEHALGLLQQAGQPAPAGVPGSVPWLQQLIDGLCELSSRDALTGLANRRSFERALDREVDRVARTGEAALVLMLDIDHFKRVNDTWGHGVGDTVIREVARSLADNVRPMDFVARLGGEEFAAILPNCAPAFAEVVAERLRMAVESAAIETPAGESIRVTLSLGGAFAPPWVRSTAALWLERADRQLYRAKAEGRNRSCLDLPPTAHVSAEEKGMLFGTSQFQDLL